MSVQKVYFSNMDKKLKRSSTILKIFNDYNTVYPVNK